MKVKRGYGGGEGSKRKEGEGGRGGRKKDEEGKWGRGAIALVVHHCC